MFSDENLTLGSECPVGLDLKAFVVFSGRSADVKEAAGRIRYRSFARSQTARTARLAKRVQVWRLHDEISEMQRCRWVGVETPSTQSSQYPPSLWFPT